MQGQNLLCRLKLTLLRQIYSFVVHPTKPDPSGVDQIQLTEVVVVEERERKRE